MATSKKSETRVLNDDLILSELRALRESIDRVEARLSKEVVAQQKKLDHLQVQHSKMGTEVAGVREDWHSHKVESRNQGRHIDDERRQLGKLFQQTKDRMAELEDKLGMIATPEKVLAPVYSELRKLSKQVLQQGAESAGGIEKLHKNLTDWVPEYRRQGRPSHS